MNNNNYRIKYACITPVNIIKNACSIVLQNIRCHAIDCMGHFDEKIGGNKFKQNAIELINGTIL